MTLLLVIVAAFIAGLGFVVIFGAPYVPTRPKDVRTTFDSLYKLKPEDVVLDIGSGDGIILREVSRRGAKAFGLEINPLLVGLSKLLSHGDPNVTVRLANLWRAEFPANTSLVYVFGESRDIKRMAAKVQREANRLDKRLMLISYGFQIPGLRETKQVGAHFLYEVVPLQAREAQV